MGIIDSLKEKIGGKKEDKSSGDAPIRKPTRKPGQGGRGERMPERESDKERRRRPKKESSRRRTGSNFEKSSRDKVPLGEGNSSGLGGSKSPSRPSGGGSKDRMSGSRRGKESSGPGKSERSSFPGPDTGSGSRSSKRNPLTPKGRSGGGGQGGDISARSKPRTSERQSSGRNQRKDARRTPERDMNEGDFEELKEQNEEMISLLKQIRDRL